MARHLKAARSRWFDALPAVTAEIDCGGKEHRITWRRGKLIVEDHDVRAEQSLAALGGKPPVCVEVRDAWRKMRNAELLYWPGLLYDLLLDDSVLSPEDVARRKESHEAVMESVGPIPPSTRARLKNHPQGAEMLHQLERQAAERLEREKRMWAITLVEALPTALRRTLALSVIVNVARHWHDEAFRRKHAQHLESSLTAIAAPLFEQSVRRWRRNLKPYAGFVAEAWLVAPGEEPKCAAWADSGGAYAALSLPVSWFTDVWARGIALVDGCFVLGLADNPRDHAELHVVALRWERQDREISRSVAAPALVTRGRVGDWRLRWT